MGILSKKRKLQTGGSLFGDSRFIDLTPEIPIQQYTGGQGVRGTGSSKVDSSGKKEKDEDADRKGFLPSDIAFYESRVNQLKQAMETGIREKGPDFVKSPEFLQMNQELYNLVKVDYYSMSNMAKVYTSGKSMYDSKGNKAGDEPAIIDGKAIVQTVVKDEKGNDQVRYGVVTVDELLQNAKSFKLLDGRSVIELRQKDPNFSGFTEAGRMADRILSRSYGSRSFDDDIYKAIDEVGYHKRSGIYYTRDNQALDLDNFDFKSDNTGFISKSNVENLGRLIIGINEQKSNLSEYLDNATIQTLYNKAAIGEIDQSKFADPKFTNEMFVRAKGTKLFNKLRTAVDLDITEASKSAGQTGLDKKVETNFLLNAAMTVFSSDQGIEMTNLNSVDPETGSVIQRFPATSVPDAADYFDEGYHGGSRMKTDADKDATEFNRKTLKNNKNIFKIQGNKSVISTADGTPLQELVNDNDLNNAIIPTNPDFQLMLAPTEQKDGKTVVNFKNKYVPQMYEATQRAYELLEKEGISPEDVIKGDKKVLERFETLSKQAFMEITKDKGIAEVPTMRMVLAFKVQYDANGDSFFDVKNDEYPEGKEDTKHIWIPTDSGDELYSVIEEKDTFLGFGKNAQETYAFLPIDQSFWTEIQYPDAFGEKYKRTIERGKQAGALSTKNNMGKLNIKSMITAEAFRHYGTNKKKYGGKLIDIDEFSDLLFK